MAEKKIGEMIAANGVALAGVGLGMIFGFIWGWTDAAAFHQSEMERYQAMVAEAFIPGIEPLMVPEPFPFPTAFAAVSVATIVIGVGLAWLSRFIAKNYTMTINVQKRDNASPPAEP